MFLLGINMILPIISLRAQFLREKNYYMRSVLFTVIVSKQFAPISIRLCLQGVEGPFPELSESSGPFIAAMLWIRDILLLARIRIRGSVQLTYGSGSGSRSFRQWPSRCQQEIFFPSFFAYYFFKVHLRHSSKINTVSHKDVTKQQKSRLFLLFFIDDGSIQIGGPKTHRYGSGSGPITLLAEKAAE